MNANERELIMGETIYQKMETDGFQSISLFASICVYSRLKTKEGTANERG